MSALRICFLSFVWPSLPTHFLEAQFQEILLHVASNCHILYPNLPYEKHMVIVTDHSAMMVLFVNSFETPYLIVVLWDKHSMAYFIYPAEKEVWDIKGIVFYATTRA